MVDIARPESVKRKKKVRRVIYGAAALVGIAVITLAVSRLKPAAPSVERATVWIDTVKRGPMTRQVRGSGTLIPEDIRWIPATTQGRVERILLRPGRRGEAGHGDPRDEQPGPPAVGQGRPARLPVRRSGLPQQEGGSAEPVPEPAGRCRDDRGELQPGEARSRGQRAAAEGRPGLGPDRQVEEDAGDRPGESPQDCPAATQDDGRGPQVAAGAAGSGRQPQASGVRAEHAQARRPPGQGGHDRRPAAGPGRARCTGQPRREPRPRRRPDQPQGRSAHRRNPDEGSPARPVR